MKGNVERLIYFAVYIDVMYALLDLYVIDCSK